LRADIIVRTHVFTSYEKIFSTIATLHSHSNITAAEVTPHDAPNRSDKKAATLKIQYIAFKPMFQASLKIRTGKANRRRTALLSKNRQRVHVASIATRMATHREKPKKMNYFSGV